jgi:uncharacterized protein YggE
VDRLVEIVDEGAEGAHPMAAAAFARCAESDLALVIDPQQQTVRAAVTVRVTITNPTPLNRRPHDSAERTLP